MWRLILTAALLLALMGCGKEDSDSLMKEGFICFQQQDYDGAIKYYEKAVAQGAKSSSAYNMLGMAYRFKYQETKASEMKDSEIISFQKALQIDPRSWAAMINLGHTYYAQGDKAAAARLFKEALALNPNHPEKAQIDKMIAEGGKPPETGKPARRSSPRSRSNSE